MFIMIKKDVPTYPLSLYAPWKALRALSSPIPLTSALKVLGETSTSHNLPVEAAGVLEELIDADYARVITS